MQALWVDQHQFSSIDYKIIAPLPRISISDMCVERRTSNQKRKNVYYTYRLDWHGKRKWMVSITSIGRFPTHAVLYSSTHSSACPNVVWVDKMQTMRTIYCRFIPYIRRTINHNGIVSKWNSLLTNYLSSWGRRHSNRRHFLLFLWVKTERIVTRNKREMWSSFSFDFVPKGRVMHISFHYT